MKTIPKTDPRSLVDTRIQLHWAAQILSAAADAALNEAEDDSHSNLAWNLATNRLEGRVGASIDVVNFVLNHENESLDLHGHSLHDALGWLGKRLGASLRARDYDMPSHDVSAGAAFEPNDQHLQVIADWYTFGSQALQGQGELRVWPHHFDLGFFQPDPGEGKSLGGGFTPGDEHIPIPYIYINPYGIDRPNHLPELANGCWTDKWFGAVLTAEDLDASDADTVAGNFVKDAVSICQRLLADAG